MSSKTADRDETADRSTRRGLILPAAWLAFPLAEIARALVQTDTGYYRGNLVIQWGPKAKKHVG